MHKVFNLKRKARLEIIDHGRKMKILHLLKHLKSCATLDINTIMVHLNQVIQLFLKRQ